LLLEYVFLEVVTVLLVRRDLAVATRVGRLLLDAEELEFVPCSDLFLETLQTFRRCRVVFSVHRPSRIDLLGGVGPKKGAVRSEAGLEPLELRTERKQIQVLLRI
jgi:hypothetical protein